MRFLSHSSHETIIWIAAVSFMYLGFALQSGDLSVYKCSYSDSSGLCRADRTLLSPDLC